MRSRRQETLETKREQTRTDGPRLARPRLLASILSTAVASSAHVTKVWERNRWYMTKASGTQSTRPGGLRPGFPSLYSIFYARRGGRYRPARSRTVTSAQPALPSTWFPIIRDDGLPSQEQSED
ncbi:hypothetical protein THAOC_02528 [Thalassiosira oceanica]|uniref:Uncharacterized protein n=1 Tax=Thalassiosira oceanica TaxID=159749 RepID=K0TED9_THAOC|nr:hypothetical protein THAOC_02528 [Thalassiosira oceanica]|eukprot:EJK75740.1 hypothetical protein THAOC_02528 [Thalassiosira oceanica]